MFSFESTIWDLYLKPGLIIQYVLLILNVRYFFYYFKFIFYIRNKIHILKDKINSRSSNCDIGEIFKKNESIYYSTVSFIFPKEIIKLISKIDKECLNTKKDENTFLEKCLLLIRYRIVLVNFLSIFFFFLFAILIYIRPYRFLVGIQNNISFNQIFSSLEAPFSFFIVFILNFFISLWISINSQKKIIWLTVEIDKIKNSIDKEIFV